MMSKERELLKRWLAGEANQMPTHILLLIETQNLLAQPEQKPVAWRWKGKKYDSYLYLDNGAPDYPEDCESLYTSPPKREPLSDEEAHVLCQNRTLLGGTVLELLRDVEKAHDITGGE